MVVRTGTEKSVGLNLGNEYRARSRSRRKARRFCARLVVHFLDQALTYFQRGSKKSASRFPKTYRLIMSNETSAVAPPATFTSWHRCLWFLAPAVPALLPVFVLAALAVTNDEAYEWTQHRLVGVTFATVFAATFIGGRWRYGWTSTLAVLVTLAVLIAMTFDGVPGFNSIFVLTGAIVAGGYWWARRADAPSVGEVFFMGFSSTLCFWAASRLSWWQSFIFTLTIGPNLFLFLGVTVILVLVLGQLDRPDARTESRHVWLGWAVDILIIAALAGCVMRTTFLEGNVGFPHHWSVYTVPADMVRGGHALLGGTPSQYGFLSILVLAALPTDDRFTALFWLNSTLVWFSGLIVYYALRTWLAHWWWRLCAGQIAICSVAFICGDAASLCGPLPYPSVGAMRFIWVHLILGFLLWRHRRHPHSSVQQNALTLWIGSGIWLLGVLWSVESAVYVTATWFPAASLLSMRQGVEGLRPWARVRALFAGIVRTVVITGLLLIGTIASIFAFYQLALARSPEWHAYLEYAVAFSDGFGALPIESQGSVWVLLMLHTALLAAIVGLDIDRKRSATVLVWAAWGALWSVSTYYVVRSHLNNITNLSPILLLIVGLFVHARDTSSGYRNLALPWIWLVVPPFVGAMLWLVLTNPAALQRQLAGFYIQPRAARLLTPSAAPLGKLIKQCQQVFPGPYSVVGSTCSDVVGDEMLVKHTDWLPLRSMPQLNPLPQQRRDHYLDVYNRSPTPGWLIAPSKRSNQELYWLFNYIDTRFTIRATLELDGWQAWYCYPRSGLDHVSPLP